MIISFKLNHYLFLNFSKLVNENYTINVILDAIYNLNKDKIKLKTNSNNNKKNKSNTKNDFLILDKILKKNKTKIRKFE